MPEVRRKAHVPDPTFELDMARDSWGRSLAPHLRNVLRVYVNADLPGMWPSIADMVVWNSPPLPLWCAVEAVSPGASGRELRLGDDGKVTVTWNGAPSPLTVFEALRYATH